MVKCVVMRWFLRAINASKRVWGPQSRSESLRRSPRPSSCPDVRCLVCRCRFNKRFRAKIGSSSSSNNSVYRAFACPKSLFCLCIMHTDSYTWELWLVGLVRLGKGCFLALTEDGHRLFFDSKKRRYSNTKRVPLVGPPCTIANVHNKTITSPLISSTHDSLFS